MRWLQIIPFSVPCRTFPARGSGLGRSPRTGQPTLVARGERMTPPPRGRHSRYIRHVPGPPTMWMAHPDGSHHMAGPSIRLWLAGLAALRCGSDAGRAVVRICSRQELAGRPDVSCHCRHAPFRGRTAAAHRSAAPDPKPLRAPGCWPNPQRTYQERSGAPVTQQRPTRQRRHRHRPGRSQ